MIIIQLQELFANGKPSFQPADRAVISNVLERPLPNEIEVSRRIAELFVYDILLFFLAVKTILPVIRQPGIISEAMLLCYGTRN
jgi:hypothetical protein